jgi:Flp pilus assembly pilin Flp
MTQSPRILPPSARRLLGARGATMVEYALLIIAIMFLAATAYRNLGKSARKNADESSAELLKR